MKITVARVASVGALALIVGGCSSNLDRPTGPGWGPAEVSFAGLRYTGADNSICCGGSFEGLDVTAEMPTTGTATLSGVLRGDLNGEYRDGSSQVVADFSSNSVEVSGRLDFTGVPNGTGIVTFRQSAELQGNHFQGGDERGDVFGHFYGEGAKAVAGTIGTTTASGDHVTGAFIAKR